MTINCEGDHSGTTGDIYMLVGVNQNDKLVGRFELRCMRCGQVISLASSALPAAAPPLPADAHTPPASADSERLPPDPA